jgi:hypothetical protein
VRSWSPLALCVTAACTLVVGPARAEPAGAPVPASAASVTVAASARSVRLDVRFRQALRLRLSAELHALGYAIRDGGASDTSEVSRDDSPSLAAWIRLGPSREIEIWTREDAALRRREVLVERDDAADSAVRVSEALHAYLASSFARPSPAVPAEQVPAPVAAPSGRAGRRGRWYIAGEAAMALPTSGLSSSMVLSLRTGAWVTERLSVGVMAVAPISPATVTATASETRAHVTVLGPEAALRLTSESSALAVGVRGGAALVWVNATGSADAPNVGTTTNAFTGLAFGAMELAYPIAGTRASLRASGLVGYAVPRFRLQHGATRVADWGAPLVLLGLGVEVSL